MGDVIFPSVRAAWRPWNAPLEGVVSWMYLDTEGYVTTGMGNLIDPVDLALRLPWVLPSGALASQFDISSAWQHVKSDPDLASEGSDAARAATNLRLPNAAIDSLVQAELDGDIVALLTWPAFADLVTWPADAQLGLLSMAWAMGPRFAHSGDWPHFSAACQARDWGAAASQCAMTDNPPPRWRNCVTSMAFLLAKTTELVKSDFSVLHSPVPPLPLPVEA